jgi:hypothetical protein
MANDLEEAGKAAAPVIATIGGSTAAGAGIGALCGGPAGAVVGAGVGAIVGGVGAIVYALKDQE